MCFADTPEVPTAKCTQCCLASGHWPWVFLAPLCHWVGSTPPGLEAAIHRMIDGKWQPHVQPYGPPQQQPSALLDLSHQPHFYSGLAHMGASKIELQEEKEENT